MENLIIYKENKIKDIKAIKYYRDISVNGILLDNFENLEELDQLFSWASYLKTNSIR